MTKTTVRLLVVIATVLLASVPSFATITVEVNPLVSYQQTTNNPCVIGDPSCKEPAGMTYTSYSGTPLAQNSTYDAYSPTYTVTQLIGFLGGKNSFQIGIDENFANGTETLQDLTVWVCTSSCTSFAANFFSPPSGSQDAALIAGGYSVLDQTNTTYGLVTHNGNGYSDALSSTISLASLAGTAKIVFEASVSNDTDGMEEFFLIPTGTPVDQFMPEPASILLFGTLLAGTGFCMRKRFVA